MGWVVPVLAERTRMLLVTAGILCVGSRWVTIVDYAMIAQRRMMGNGKSQNY